MERSPITPFSKFTQLQFSSSKLKVKNLSLLITLLLMSTLTLSAADIIPEPVIIVKSQTNLLLSELSSRKKEFDENPESLIYFARHVALSHWNLNKTSRLMLGKHWYNATVDHRKQFEEEFLRTLMRYVVKAYGYYDESFVEVLSYRWKASAKGGWVKSIIKLPAGFKVSVDYRMMLDKQKQWKLIDIRVEGISLVGAKKGEYRQIIRSEGFDGLIKSMSAKNQKVLKSEPHGHT